MLDRLYAYSSTLETPERWAIATVIATSGSVPRPIGTSMAVRDDALTIGSVSGGCVESAVVDAALTCIADRESMICEFGISDEDGLSVGLMCGGNISVVIEPVASLADAMRSLLGASAESDVASGEAVDNGVVIRPLPRHVAIRNGQLTEETGQPALAGSASELPTVALAVTESLPESAAASFGRAAVQVEEIMRRGGCGVVETRDESVPECPTTGSLFVESRRPQARILIYGANDFSSAIAQASSFLGLQVTVCDAREVFATRARHPGANDVIVARPGDHFAREREAGRIDSRTAVIMLTHDPRFDLPVLDQALRMDLAYVGAMGSRSTHERRAQELIHGGLPPECFARLHSPIGLDIGARSPQEVAIAVLAELVAVTHGRATSDGIPELRNTSGPVHAAHQRKETVSWT